MPKKSPAQKHSEWRDEQLNGKIDKLHQRLRKLLRLRDIDIEYHITSTIESESGGTVDGRCTYNLDWPHDAEIAYTDYVASCHDPEVTLEVIIHEHLHLVMKDYHSYVKQHLDPVHQEWLAVLHERTINHLTYALKEVLREEF